LIFGTLAACWFLCVSKTKPFYLFVAPTILVCAIAFGMSATGRLVQPAFAARPGSARRHCWRSA